MTGWPRPDPAKTGELQCRRAPVEAEDGAEEVKLNALAIAHRKSEHAHQRDFDAAPIRAYADRAAIDGKVLADRGWRQLHVEFGHLIEHGLDEAVRIRPRPDPIVAASRHRIGGDRGVDPGD